MGWNLAFFSAEAFCSARAVEPVVFSRMRVAVISPSLLTSASM